MARTPIADLSAEVRNSTVFIGTVNDGSAFTELMYQSGQTLRKDFVADVDGLPYFYMPDFAYLISRVTYYGPDDDVIFDPPNTHYYWERVCVFNYRYGLADFAFLGGIGSSNLPPYDIAFVKHRHVAQLKIVGSRIPCTLRWKDTKIHVFPHPGVGDPLSSTEEVERELSFGPGSWEQTLDDGYPPTDFGVLRGIGRVIPAGG